MAVALLPNQQIFNAYLIWGDQPVRSGLLRRAPADQLADHPRCRVSVTFLALVALFYVWYGKRYREPDEITKMIIGSVFSIGGMLCLFMAAATTAPGEKIGLFWPVMFHLFNSVGFAHMLPVSLALFAKVAPRAINATVIGLYYLAFFAANATVGWVGGWLETMPITSFWLLHAAFATVAGAVFVLFKLFLAKHLTQPEPVQALA